MSFEIEIIRFSTEFIKANQARGINLPPSHEVKMPIPDHKLLKDIFGKKYDLVLPHLEPLKNTIRAFPMNDDIEDHNKRREWKAQIESQPGGEQLLKEIVLQDQNGGNNLSAVRIAITSLAHLADRNGRIDWLFYFVKSEDCIAQAHGEVRSVDSDRSMLAFLNMDIQEKEKLQKDLQDKKVQAWNNFAATTREVSFDVMSILSNRNSIPPVYSVSINPVFMQHLKEKHTEI